ncbi:hypothetical protein Q674_02045 [Acinetobacter sp. COS3]|nr:hypothetical protein Q674_02045 [Acinetobacter sp. COS3]
MQIDPYRKVKRFESHHTSLPHKKNSKKQDVQISKKIEQKMYCK